LLLGRGPVVEAIEQRVRVRLWLLWLSPLTSRQVAEPDAWLTRRRVVREVAGLCDGRAVPGGR